jgi:hypothetical protein
LKKKKKEMQLALVLVCLVKESAIWHCFLGKEIQLASRLTIVLLDDCTATKLAHRHDNEVPSKVLFLCIWVDLAFAL